MLQDKTFYFLQEQYFIDFPDKGLMKNHETINGKRHNRPCFYTLKDEKYKEILWMIPISSKLEKYRNIYNKKISKYKKCDTLAFGKVLGEERVFLIQNIFPVTKKYLSEQYIFNQKPVTIISSLQKELKRKAINTISLTHQNVKIAFPDILKIRTALIKQLERENARQKAIIRYKQKLNLDVSDKRNNHGMIR